MGRYPALLAALEFTAMGISLVQIQTLRGNGGMAATLAEVEKAVAAHNAAHKAATPHVVVNVPVMPNNQKGMQWQLALLATLARVNGCTMVRLSVHNANVALCGTPASIAATQAAMMPAYIAYSTAASAAYNADAHGNRVGFLNGYLCGCPAGLQVASGVSAVLAYGLGYLFTFPAPGSGTAYAMGQSAAEATAKALVKAAPKPVSKASPRITPKAALKAAPKAADTADESTPLAIAADAAA